MKVSAHVGTPAMAVTATAPKAASRRVLPIDAARGLVMLFSCLAHFAWWIHAAYPQLSLTLAGIGMVATPTFLLLSGAMVGLLCAAATQGGRDLRSQLFNRGLFLLTVGHVLIALAETHQSGNFWRTLRGVTVVDDIGLCTLVAAFFTTQLANRNLCITIAKIAGVVLFAAWLGNLLWSPASPAVLDFEDVLIGGNIKAPDFATNAPVLQHLAIYCIGLPLGHYFASFVRREISLQTVATKLASIGVVLALAAVALRMVRYVLEHAYQFDNAAMDFSLKITEKTPPSPAYLLFFGGCGLLFIAAMFRMTAIARPWAQSSLEWMAVIGRASLFVFVLQYFLYWTLPDLLNIHPNKLAGALFIGNVLLMRYLAGMWGQLRGNRWLTFGIKLRGAPPVGG